MSEGDVPVLRVVCEGDTDFIVIEAVLSSVLGEYSATMIQPERSLFAGKTYSELGSGWQGVRRWCEDHKSRFGRLTEAMARAPLREVSALIIHVDADIASHPDVNCRKTCPPAARTVDALRAIVLGWVGEESAPERTVLCIPCESTEAWVFVALYPAHRLARPPIECRRKPETLLKQRPERLVSGKDNRKDREAYRGVSGRFAQAWGHVCRVCSQAERLDRELRAALPQTPHAGRLTGPVKVRTHTGTSGRG